MENGWGPEVLAKHMSGLVFCPQYRLAVYPKSHSPVASKMASRPTHPILSQGISASDMVISADSAGGDLALVLLRPDAAWGRWCWNCVLQ